jgi:hypothetical protein
MSLRTPAVAFVLALASAATASASADDSVCNESYEQGQVLRKDHKLADAREQFRTCVNTCTLEAKKKACGDWLAAVDHDIPTVVVSAKDANGATLIAVTVTLDGKPFATSLNGRAMEVEPDAHTFEFQTPDGARVEVKVVVAEGEKAKPVSATFAKGPADETKAQSASGVAAGGPPGTGTAAPAAPATPPVERSRLVASSSPLKTIGLAMAGAGAVGLGAGAVFGVLASSQKSDASCDSNSVCRNDAAASKLRDAKSSADLSTVLFIAGGALAAGGLTLWALGPSKTVYAAPTVGSRAAGFVVEGTW